jgi:hypothetical protein
MEQLILVTNRAELKETLLEILRESKTDEVPELKIEEKLDRRQSAKFLGVSYQTMYNWTKAGVVKEHGKGRKKFYLRPELIEAMKNNG